MPDYNYNSFGMGPVRRRTPIGMNISAFADAVTKLDAKYQQQAQQQSAIDMALAQLPVNAAEDEWRMNLSDEIRQQINSVDNPNDRLLTSIKAAGQLMNRPDVIGRIRAQAEYDNFVKQTQARQDLTEDDKAWALYKNPYSYSDTRDSSGRIIGGTMWKANRTPVGQIDYNKILATAKQLVFQEAGGSTNVVFFDEKGNDTTDMTKAQGVKYYKDGRWQGIDKTKLNDILEAAIDNTTGARARLDQDWEVANWKYSQMSPEEQENNKPIELFASNGKKYNKQEWYNNKFGRAVNAMSGRNHTDTIKYDDSYTNYMMALRAGATGASGSKYTDDPFGGQLITSKGNPVTIETENTINKAFGKVTSGVQELENLIPSLKTNDTWNKAKNEHDYKRLADMIQGSEFISNNYKDNAYKINSVIRDLRENADIVANLNGAWSEHIDALGFNGAFTTGGELPSGKLSHQYMESYNALGGSDAVALQYSFKDYDTLQSFATNAGIDINDKSIVKIGNDNGLPTITIDKSNPINYRALKLYNDLGYENTSIESGWGKTWRGIITLGQYMGQETSVKGVNANGVAKGFGSADAGRLVRMSGIADDARNEATRVIGNNASGQIVTTTKNMQLPGVATARIKYADDESKAGSAITLAIDDAVNAINGMNGSQYDIMMLDPSTNTLSSSNIKDKTAALEDAKAYIEANRSAAKDFLGIKAVDGKIGYRIQINQNYNKTKNAYVNGDIQPTEIVIFGVDDPLLQRMERQSDFQATTKFERLSRINGSKAITFDNNVIQFDNGGVKINGIYTNKEEAITLLAKDYDYNILKSNITSQGYKVGLAQFIKEYYGYEPNSNAGLAKAQEITNQIINELR